jgi:hypothetical protein
MDGRVMRALVGVGEDHTPLAIAENTSRRGVNPPPVSSLPASTASPSALRSQPAEYRLTATLLGGKAVVSPPGTYAVPLALTTIRLSPRSSIAGTVRGSRDGHRAHGPHTRATSPPGRSPRTARAPGRPPRPRPAVEFARSATALLDRPAVNLHVLAADLVRDRLHLLAAARADDHIRAVACERPPDHRADAAAGDQRPHGRRRMPRHPRATPEPQAPIC